MTGNSNRKLRAVFLAALMFLWVFAGTVAFAGGAAAANTSSISVGNTEALQDVTNDGSLDGDNLEDDGEIEIESSIELGETIEVASSAFPSGVTLTSADGVTVTGPDSGAVFDIKENADSLTVSGLDITGADTGITIADDASGVTVEDSSITGNSVVGVDAGASDATISNNNIESFGVGVSATDAASVSGNSYTDVAVEQQDPGNTPQGITDNTGSAQAGTGQVGVSVADLDFDSAGEVDSVDVNLVNSPGTDADATADDISEITVSGVNVEETTVPYDQDTVTVTFDSTQTSVSEIDISANIDDQARAGTIDALVTLNDADSGSNTINTQETQEIITSGGGLSDFRGNVENRLTDEGENDVTVQIYENTGGVNIDGSYDLADDPDSYLADGDLELVVEASSREVQNNGDYRASAVLEDTGEYLFTLAPEEHEQFDVSGAARNIQLEGTTSQDITVEPLELADRVTLESPDDPTSVAVEESVDASVLVETQDPVTEEFSALQGENVNANVVSTDNPNANDVTVDFDSDSVTTGPDGNADFEVSLSPDAGTLEDLEEDVTTTVEFVADSTGESAELTITFETEVRGTGTISGQVDEYVGDQQLGVQDLEGPSTQPAADTQVHAVRLNQFVEDSETENDNIANEVGIPDLSEGEAYRVVSVDPATGETTVEDARKDYLVSTGTAEVVQNETSLGFDVDADGSATLRFLENDTIYRLEQYDTATDEFEAVESFGGSITVDDDSVSPIEYAIQTPDRDLTAQGIDDRFSDDPASPTDRTNSQGGFELVNLPTGEYVVIAGGIGTETADDTAQGYANFRGFDRVTVQENAQEALPQEVRTANQYDVDLTVEEIEIENVYSYELDVQLETEDGELVKEDRIASGNSIDVRVDVTAVNQDTDEVAAPAAIEGQEIDLTLRDPADNTLLAPEDDNAAAEFGALEQETVSVGVVDGDAVANTTFTADELQTISAGTANISAATVNARDQIYDTRDGVGVGQNDNGNQAQISVYQDAQVTGSVTDGPPSETLIPNSTVELYRIADNGDLVPVRTVDQGNAGNTGIDGSYSFTKVPAGESYRVVAEDPVTGETGFNQGDLEDLSAGSNTADIVIEDAEPPEGLTVSNLDPSTATIEQGEPLSVTADITNPAVDEEATETVELRLDDQTVASQEVSVDGASTVSVTFDLTGDDTQALDPGEYTHRITTESSAVEDVPEGTLTITANNNGDGLTEDELRDAYGNEVDGSVETTGLVTGISDWRNDDIETPDLIQLIDLWRSDQ